MPRSSGRTQTTSLQEAVENPPASDDDFDLGGGALPTASEMGEVPEGTPSDNLPDAQKDAISYYDRPEWEEPKYALQHSSTSSLTYDKVEYDEVVFQANRVSWPASRAQWLVRRVQWPGRRQRPHLCNQGLQVRCSYAVNKAGQQAMAQETERSAIETRLYKSKL